jgi:hypothetical protein
MYALGLATNASTYLPLLLTVAARAEKSSRIVFMRSAKPAETPQSSDVGVMPHD